MNFLRMLFNLISNSTDINNPFLFKGGFVNLFYPFSTALEKLDSINYFSNKIDEKNYWTDDIDEFCKKFLEENLFDIILF